MTSRVWVGWGTHKRAISCRRVSGQGVILSLVMPVVQGPCSSIMYKMYCYYVL